MPFCAGHHNMGAELQALYDNLWQIRIVNYVTISCVAFLVYDIFTNLDREVPLIWRYYNNADNDERFKPLFVFGRYYALLYLAFASFADSCTHWLTLLLAAGKYFTRRSSTVILVIRLNAIMDYEGHQVFLASVVAEFIVTWIQKRVIEPPAGIPWPGCMLSEDPNTALDTPRLFSRLTVAIFLGLTLRLLYSSMRLRFERFGDFTISNIKREIRNIQPMTLTMIRDSVLFYFPMFGVLVASVPVTALYRTALATVTAPIILALYSFCASRLIIHTRESFARPFQDLSSRGTEPINFASRASHVGMHA
ncbi:hypothetical protein BKA83DRAFT_677759 [Pisolithus microcarpus]|nr:hypothetical protein BKA83DRAFT_677759 [Pisolithus microcarpus]